MGAPRSNSRVKSVVTSGDTTGVALASIAHHSLFAFVISTRVESLLPTSELEASHELWCCGFLRAIQRGLYKDLSREYGDKTARQIGRKKLMKKQALEAKRKEEAAPVEGSQGAERARGFEGLSPKCSRDKPEITQGVNPRSSRNYARGVEGLSPKCSRDKPEITQGMNPRSSRDYARGVEGLSLKCSRDKPEITQGLNLRSSRNYARGVEGLSPKCSRDKPEITQGMNPRSSRDYAQGVEGLSPKCSRDMPEITQGMNPRSSGDYARGVEGLSPR
ncbi:hypothetical protein SESBI_37987 [Sesbania bispinosa]|nr:hypothetical protein SESBI_37987 [Sesbania bispinosa]